METLKLRRIQEPARLELLLEAFILRARSLPEGAYQVREPGALPKGLQAVIARATKNGQAWSCWARGAEVWLFTCDMSLALSRERGAPVIVVRVYGEDGEVMESGTWRYGPLGAWSRCAD